MNAREKFEADIETLRDSINYSCRAWEDIATPHERRAAIEHIDWCIRELEAMKARLQAIDGKPN